MGELPVIYRRKNYEKDNTCRHIYRNDFYNDFDSVCADR